MAFPGQSCPQTVIQDSFPKIGDHLARRFGVDRPPSPIRPPTTLRPIRLSAEDYASFAVSSPRQEKTTPRLDISPHKTLPPTTYARFFDAPEQSTVAVNDPKAYLIGKEKMNRGAGNILGSFLYKEGHDVPPTDGSDSTRRREKKVVEPIPLPPPTPVPPPKGYADRMLAQADHEELLMIARSSARKKISEVPLQKTAPPSQGALKNLFVVHSAPPVPSPRRSTPRR